MFVQHQHLGASLSFTTSIQLIGATKAPGLKHYRDLAESIRNDRELDIDTSSLSVEELTDLVSAARTVNDTKTCRAVESILLARKGTFDKPVPNFKAFKGVLEAFLKVDCIDGWIYVNADDGKLYPQLVTAITYDDGNHGRGKNMPTVRIHTACYGFNRDGNHKVQFSSYHTSHTFYPQSVANRRISDILAAAGIYKETDALRDEHTASLERHLRVTGDAFGRQFRFSGTVYHFEESNHNRRGQELSGRRVIHDLDPKDYGAAPLHMESCIVGDSGSEGAVGKVPEHPLVKVFDLRTHEFFWVNSDFLSPYAYDKSLRNKLVLPPTHRELLDVLTSDLDAFVSDFVEGKSAGNVILCKGIPGVGKTLTAEVYAELIERPLYSIHSGSLGTTADQIEANLRMIFQRGKRWGCVLLLDEADVFVVTRGENIEQNAIVAEFLRTLEYFDGLLFMTTNRPNDIDEAIISRCAAIIDYAPPAAEDAAAIWRVMASQFETKMSEGLIGELVREFPGLAPRDAKMLLRLALRVATAHNKPLSLKIFTKCAMFRAVKMRADGP